MYYDNIDKCFIKYLNSKGINCVEKFDNLDKDNISDSKIKDQICFISEFHIKTNGYTEHMNKRLSNEIGKTVEQYKIYIKRLDKQLKELIEKGPNNDFEKLLLNHGYSYLARAKNSIETILRNDYIDLITRSMKKVEMCLGNTYFTNLRKINNLEIIDINGCCYNMVEMDLCYFLSKIKKKRKNVDFYSLILDFCKSESLEQNSCKFILSIISYPYEFIKCCNRYRDKSKNWSIDEYVLKLQRAIIADGESLI